MTDSFALVTFSVGDSPRCAGLLIDDRLVSIADAASKGKWEGAGQLTGGSVLELLRNWDSSWDLLRELADRIRAGLDVPGTAAADARFHMGSFLFALPSLALDAARVSRGTRPAGAMRRRITLWPKTKSAATLAAAVRRLEQRR